MENKEFRLVFLQKRNYCSNDDANPFIGSATTGFVGAIPLVFVAILMLVFYFGKEENNVEM